MASTKVTAAAPNRTTARAPFDGKMVHDIIFTTSDHVDFYIAKTILVYASPFFADMFSLAQPEQRAGDLERIPVSEDSQVFAILMRYCYPVADPFICDLGQLEEVLEAAQKYQMSEGVELLRILLREYISESSPDPRSQALRVYAIACRLKCELEAGQAAGLLKRLGCGNEDSEIFAETVAGMAYISEMASLTAGAYRRLVDYLRPNGVTPSSFAEPTPGGSHSPDTPDHGSANVDTPSLLDADVVLRSVDGTDIPVHTMILRLAGAENLVEARTERSKGVPVCSVDISGVTLRDLVSMFYPFSQDTTLPFGRLASLARAAHKYNISGAIASARKQLVPLIQQEPLKGWVLANAYGWAEEWEASAREIASRCLANQWVAEMEDVPAYPYYRLLRFCHLYAVEVGKFMRSQVPNSGTIWWSQHTDPTTPVSLPILELTSNATELAIRHGGSCFFCGHYTYSHRHDCPYFLQVWPADKKTYANIALSFLPQWNKLFKQRLLKLKPED